VPRSNLSLRLTSTARLSRLLGDVGIGNRYDIARFYEAEFIIISCDLEDLWAVCHEVRAFADRRTKALKRNVFHERLSHGQRRPPKDNPLGNRA
jgi:hypothetical protein